MAVSGYDIMAYAKQFVGTPYVWGGNSLSGGIDCSGLVQQVYKKFGITVPRVTYDQIGEGKAVRMNELQAGDMVFFDTDPGRGGPDHVGLYLGNGKMLHAPRPGKGVEITDMTNGYYQKLFMGGRRVSGIAGGGPSGDWTPEQTGTVARLDREQLASEYGWAYSYLKSIPEVNKLFDSYVSETWSKEKFQAEIRNTNWWKTNSETMRQAKQEKATDPATYNAKVTAARIKVQQMAAELGAPVPPKTLDKIAEQVIQTGLDDALLQNILGQYVNFTDKNTMTGKAGMIERSMKEFAYQQGVKLDRQTIKNNAQLVVRGLAGEQDFQQQIIAQASSMYPAYAEQLQAGQTMRQVASPYIQQMAQDLGLADSSISLDDPMIKSALNGVDSKGKPVGMSITNFQGLIRNDPRWAQTGAARDSVMGAGMQVLQNMGLIGGR